MVCFEMQDLGKSVRSLCSVGQRMWAGMANGRIHVVADGRLLREWRAHQVSNHGACFCCEKKTKKRPPQGPILFSSATWEGEGGQSGFLFYINLPPWQPLPSEHADTTQADSNVSLDQSWVHTDIKMMTESAQSRRSILQITSDMPRQRNSCFGCCATSTVLS